MTIERLAKDKIAAKWEEAVAAIMAESMRTAIAIDIENSGISGDCDVFFPEYSRTKGRVFIGFSAADPSKSYGYLLTPQGAMRISGSERRAPTEFELQKVAKITEIICKHDRALGEKLIGHMLHSAACNA